MTQYKPYAEYKESGVEWLGAVPSHWKCKKLKRIAMAAGGAGFPQDFQGDTSEEIPFFKVKHLVDGMTSSEHHVSRPTAKRLGATIFPAGTVAFAKVGAALLLNRRVVMPVQGCIDNNLMALSIKRNTLPEWVKLQLTLIDFGILVNPGAVPSVNQEQVDNLGVALPPLPEQQAIANFLDRETAKIDALIEKKSKFIELLEEKRQALISHAVTKGLNPDAPMKDSGVPWLGEVPAHWTVKSVKRVARSAGGAGFPHEFQGETTHEIPFFKVGNLNNGLTYTQHSISRGTARQLSATVFPKGTVAFAKVGAALLLNRKVVMPIDGCIDNNLMALRVTTFDLPDWIRLQLTLIDFGELVNPGAVPSINQEQIDHLNILLPPLPEQQAIANFVDRETERIDAMVRHVQHSIALLREKRSALITAAVTGQIDVRDEVAV